MKAQKLSRETERKNLKEGITLAYSTILGLGFPTPNDITFTLGRSIEEVELPEEFAAHIGGEWYNAMMRVPTRHEQARYYQFKYGMAKMILNRIWNKPKKGIKLNMDDAHNIFYFSDDLETIYIERLFKKDILEAVPFKELDIEKIEEENNIK